MGIWSECIQGLHSSAKLNNGLNLLFKCKNVPFDRLSLSTTRLQGFGQLNSMIETLTQGHNARAPMTLPTVTDKGIWCDNDILHALELADVLSRNAYYILKSTV